MAIKSIDLFIEDKKKCNHGNFIDVWAHKRLKKKCQSVDCLRRALTKYGHCSFKKLRTIK